MNAHKAGRVTQTTPAAIPAALDGAGAEAAWHVVDVDSGAQLGNRSDEPVVTASTFKIAVLLELNRQAAAGELSLTERVRVPADRRTKGPTGLSVMLDDIDISVRDLALWMMCVSDNTATDVLQEKVGTARINETLVELGLRSTFIEGDCHHLLSTLIEDATRAGTVGSTLTPDQMAACRSLNAEQTNRTTPREAAELLRLIWTDKAGPPEACAEVRRIMGLQVQRHRLASAFGDGVTVSSKTGTLLRIRNEIGVIEYPDGTRYAATVFLTTESLARRQPLADAVIGQVASLAIQELRPH